MRFGLLKVKALRVQHHGGVAFACDTVDEEVVISRLDAVMRDESVAAEEQRFAV
ncbi:MAG: hypothetical protein MZU84_02040 [Sphingobacterium sp.]|nr:hypothetical protein [Sphingobacterium sp.]